MCYLNPDEPMAPKNLHVKEYWTDYILVAWEPPESDGGSPLISYVVEKREASRPTWSKVSILPADVTVCKATNLFEGSDYYFRVFAENQVGMSLKAAELSTPCKAKMPFGKL